MPSTAKGIVPDALKHYESARREDVEKTQHAADVSLRLVREPGAVLEAGADAACFQHAVALQAVTYENLKRRDPQFRRRGRPLVGGQGARSRLRNPDRQSAAADVHAVPRRQHGVQNRVVVSPMNMYSAEPGNIPGDFHLVHLGRFAHGRRGSGVRRDDVGLRRRAHHAGLSGHLFARAGRGLEAHLRFRPQAKPGEILPAARPCRPQGLDPARLGGHGPAARRRQLGRSSPHRR